MMPTIEAPRAAGSLAACDECTNPIPPGTEALPLFFDGRHLCPGCGLLCNAGVVTQPDVSALDKMVAFEACRTFLTWLEMDHARSLARSAEERTAEAGR